LLLAEFGPFDFCVGGIESLETLEQVIHGGHLAEDHLKPEPLLR
jgi:hypothetical protein